MSQRARPTPGTGSGEEGRTEIRQRVIAAVGWPKSAASACRRQRRSAMPVVPDSLAARCNRRDAVIESLATSATTAASPPLLHAGEHRLVIAGIDIDHPPWRQTGLFQPRREKVDLGDAPQHLPRQARDDAGGKAGRRRAVDGAVAAACDLMQATERQPALRQAAVEFGNLEGQHRLRRAAVTLTRGDLLPQRLKGKAGMVRRHGSVGLRWNKDYLCSLFVLIVPASQSGAAQL